MKRIILALALILALAVAPRWRSKRPFAAKPRSTCRSIRSG
jgi:hypothetical protein